MSNPLCQSPSLGSGGSKSLSNLCCDMKLRLDNAMRHPYGTDTTTPTTKHPLQQLKTTVTFGLAAGALVCLFRNFIAEESSRLATASSYADSAGADVGETSLPVSDSSESSTDQV